MLKKTYDKVCELFEEGNGYLPTRTLLNNKITTIQIRTMLQEGKIEKVSHGNYWNLMSGRKKLQNVRSLYDKQKGSYLLLERMLLSRTD